MTIELHTLKSAPGARKNRKRVGRGQGSGTGKTAGRGHKGQKSRSGYSSRAGFEGGQMPIHRRLPKRGFYHENRHALAEINLDILENRFEDGAEITAEILQALGVVKTKQGGVKLLGRGEVTKRFDVKLQGASATAREKIEKAGGTLTLIQLASGGEAEVKVAETQAAVAEEEAVVAETQAAVAEEEAVVAETQAAVAEEEAVVAETQVEVAEEEENDTEADA